MQSITEAKPPTTQICLFQFLLQKNLLLSKGNAIHLWFCAQFNKKGKVLRYLKRVPTLISH